MLEIDWTLENGWAAPQISKFHNFEMNPANSTLHYAIQCFEGMKAYPNDNGKDIQLFRPMMNMNRMRKSHEALALPDFDPEQFLECIKAVVSMDKDWMPFRDNHSIYIRPTGISWEATLGVKKPAAAKLFVIMSPVGPYYPRGFVPVKMLCDTDHIRAWHKGVGDKKLGSNYGPTIFPQTKAEKKGYDQILWLVDDIVSEVGAMNLLVLWVNEDGKRELITCPLDGTILPGVTRDSILTLARETEDDLEVTERHFSIHEVIKA